MNSIIKNPTIGADPEVFLFNEQEFVSAEGKFGGTKEVPKQLNRKGFFIQEDNVMVEFNIPPASSALELEDYIMYMLQYIKTGAIQFDCKVSTAASAEFPLHQLDTPQASMFGCDPDFNAYTLDQNPPIEITNEKLRTCGGHIHIGYDKPDDKLSIELIKALDITLGLPSLLKDKDKTRKEMYGSAGAYRIKKFGVEYRTLSNFWIFDKEHIKWVYSGVNAAVQLVNSGFIQMLEKDTAINTAIRNCINKGNEGLALKLIKEVSNRLKEATVCVDC